MSKMETENKEPLTPLSALLKYKELAENPANHSEMVKDKTMVNFLAYVLDSTNEEVVATSLDIILLLCKEQSNAMNVHNTFGISEGLNAILSSNYDENSNIKEKARCILEKLKRNESPVKNCAKKVISKNKKVLTLHIHGLHLETQKELEDILMKKMKGVHSIIVDVEHQKCTVTVYENVDPKNLAQVIQDNTNMEAKLISKNKNHQEILIPLVDNNKSLDFEDLPPYLEEQPSPVNEKAVRSAKEIRITASEWFCSAAKILQKTFYW